MTESRAAHWEQVYRSRPADELSWFQATPSTSVRLIESVLPGRGSVLDVGAGSSSLVDMLLADGFEDVTVLDVSGGALDSVRGRLGASVEHVTLVQADLLEWEPHRTFDVWHDRAVLHFLDRPEDRLRYVEAATTTVRASGALIVATFAADGPPHCSGLPVTRYDPTELSEQFGTAFELVHSEREEHRTPAGEVQPFTWVVLRRR